MESVDIVLVESRVLVLVASVVLILAELEVSEPSVEVETADDEVSETDDVGDPTICVCDASALEENEDEVSLELRIDPSKPPSEAEGGNTSTSPETVPPVPTSINAAPNTPSLHGMPNSPSKSKFSCRLFRDLKCRVPGVP